MGEGESLMHWECSSSRRVPLGRAYAPGLARKEKAGRKARPTYDCPVDQGRFSVGDQKLIFRMRPSVPTSHPAFGLAKSTAQ